MKSVHITMATVATVGAALGAAVGLAAPASAVPPEGSYTRTVIQGAGIIKDGTVDQVMFTPCGPGCVTFKRPDAEGPGLNLYQQGSDWVFVDEEGKTTTINEDSLVGTMSHGPFTVMFTLVKNV